MKHIMALMVLIGSTATGMKNDPKREFYQAFKTMKYDKALELLDKDKTLANADFSAFCKEDHDETGFNETPLLSSIRDKHYSPIVFRALLAAGANINTPAANNLTPLLKSIFFKRIDSGLALLEKNADTRPRVHIYRDSSIDALELAKNMCLCTIVQKIEHATKQPATTQTEK